MIVTPGCHTRLLFHGIETPCSSALALLEYIALDGGLQGEAQGFACVDQFIPFRNSRAFWLGLPSKPSWDLWEVEHFFISMLRYALPDSRCMVPTAYYVFGAVAGQRDDQIIRIESQAVHYYCICYRDYEFETLIS